MQPQIKHVPEVRVISRRDRVIIPQIPAHSGPAVKSLIEALKTLNVAPGHGGMIYIYHGCTGDPAAEFDLEIALPVPGGVSGRPVPPAELKTAPAFRCMAVDYVGPMSGIGGAWMQLIQTVRAAGHRPSEESREVYKKWVGFDSSENVTELQQGIA